MNNPKIDPNTPNDISIYHRPGQVIQAANGAEYQVQRNGSWLRLNPKVLSKKERAKEKRVAKRAALISNSNSV